MRRKFVGVALLVAALVLIVVSFVNLAMISVAKEEYFFDNSTGTGYDINYSRNLAANHNYSIEISVHQEDEWQSRVNASVEIFIDGGLVHDVELYDFDSSDDPDDRWTRAGDSTIYEFEAIDTVNLVVSGSFYEGDYWEIRIYQDLPSSFADRTLVIIIMLVAGAVTFFVGVIIFAKSKDNH